MSFNDILGFGKVFPIDKLLDVVSNAVGRVSKSYFDKKDVDTKAYEVIKIAEAKAEEIKIIADAIKKNFQQTGGINYEENNIKISSSSELEMSHLKLNTSSIDERAQERQNFQDSKKQLNIESITAFAAEELKDEQPVTNEALDEDWITRFFRIAEDISNEEMQALWGKILAGEIKEPKSYSLRTLELIRNLSKDEAEVLMKVANFAIKSGGANYIFTGSDEKILRDQYKITYTDIALLTEIGLLQPGTFVNYNLPSSPNDSQHVFTSGNKVIIIKVKASTPKIQMPIHVFTTAGNELLTLIKSEIPIDYLKSIANSIKNESIVVQYANILDRQGSKINHTPLQNL